MEDQYTAMKCAVEEKEEIIRAVNRELVALNGALETVQQRVLELSEKNEMLEGNLRANQVILNSLVSIFMNVLFTFIDSGSGEIFVHQSALLSQEKLDQHFDNHKHVFYVCSITGSLGHIIKRDGES